jgi:hypothetical protein
MGLIAVSTRISCHARSSSTINARKGLYAMLLFQVHIVDAGIGMMCWVLTLFCCVVAVYLAAQPVITASTADHNSDSPTLVIVGSGFDATTPGNNGVAFTVAAGEAVTGSCTESTLTTLTYTYTALAPTNVGVMTAIVTLSGATASASADVATVVAGKQCHCALSHMVLRRRMKLCCFTALVTCS